MVHGARIELARRFHETDYESAATPFGIPWLIHNGRGDRIWTCGPLLPKQMLYQAEPHPVLLYGAKYQIRTGAKTLEGSYATITPISHMAKCTGLEPVMGERQSPVITASLTLRMELLTGLEPATSWLQISCSTNWATAAHNVL